jgi:bacterioferritin
MAATREQVIEMLTTAYCMELETVLNYLSNSINPDGVRAEEIKKSLAADITEELNHAQQLGQRIKQLEGRVPGSSSGKLGQTRPSAGANKCSLPNRRKLRVT